MKWIIWIIVIIAGATIDTFIPSGWNYIWGFLIGGMCQVICNHE
jgi:hypothetical protein